MERIYDPAVQPFEEEHIRIIRELGSECTVLLKKDGSFPLPEAGEIAAYGNGVRRTIRGGTGSGDVNVRHFVNIEEGLKKAGFMVTSEAWLDGYDRIREDARQSFIKDIQDKAKELGVNPVMYGMGKTMAEPEYDLPIEAAGDTAIYVLSRNSGEGSDRQTVPGDIELSETEIRDILAANTYYRKFMLVLNTGGMVDLTPVSEVKNILLLSQLGTPTGDILADILLGKAYPSGKLTMTWAPIDAYPSTEGFGDMDDTIYHEGIYVGYRYFETSKAQCAYPFGYGLGYTDFEVAPVSAIGDEKNITIEVKVVNTGNYAGRETVQVYISAPQGILDKPVKELRGFAKTGELKPGESETVKISINTADMASYDETSASYILEKGEYIILIGTDCTRTEPVALIRLDETAAVRRLKAICPEIPHSKIMPEPYSHKFYTEGILPEINICAARFSCEETAYSSEPEELPDEGKVMWDEVVRGERTLDSFVGSLTVDQMTKLCTGYHEDTTTVQSAIGAMSISLAGAAGETTDTLSDLGLPTVTMADGPAGIRISTKYKYLNGTIKSLDSPMVMFMDYMTEEQLAMAAAMIPTETEEEKAAPVCYQYCVAIPIGTALAQSWNPELCKACGDIVGDEMERFGVHFWLAPAQNIHRSPLCGRNFEYMSEDPYLSGICAGSITSGVQKHPGCAVTIKHFVCNNQETNRYVSNSILSERALREIYLKSFEISVRTCEPLAVMTSYNLVNGEHTCNSSDLVTHVLRDEWGFSGLVMTDWYVTTGELAGNSGRKNLHDPASAAGCVKAGNDITMPGSTADEADIRNALTDSSHEYKLNIADLQQTAKRVLEAVLKLS